MMYTAARLGFGSTIRKKREARNLTQLQVALHMGYSTAQFVSNWERGVSYPPAEDAARLAAILGMSSRTIVYQIYRCKQSDLLQEQREILQKLKARKSS